MFHQSSINKKIETLSLDLIKTSPFDEQDKPLFGPKFHLIEHSISEVAQANAHIQTLVGKGSEGKPRLSRALNPEEMKWVLNERAMCSCSFRYWATRYGFILDWGEQLVRFSPNVAQEMILDLFGELENMEIAILVQFLKARQLGVTTITELVILWKTIFHARTNALVASSNPEDSAKMVEKIEICFKNQPFWLIPTITTGHAGELIEFGEQDSAIAIQWGNQANGLARGRTATTFHLSEVADFRNPRKLIDASLLRAVHDSPWVFGVLEGTAKQREDYWHKKWKASVSGWPTRTSRLCPAFLPWYVGTDIYPTLTFMRKAADYFSTWEPGEMTIKHANRAGEYVRSGQNPLVTKFLGSNWYMPKEQMFFWEITRNEYAELNDLGSFYSELCADDREAFQSANRSIFSAEVTAAFTEAAKMPYGVYGLRAPQSEVPILLQASERDRDPNIKPIDLHCKWNPMQPAHDYQLVPLLHRGTGLFNPEGKIIMWEPPLPGHVYGLGTDTGYGLGQDNSVINILRKGTLDRNDEQVLEFASPNINSFALWPFNLALGTLYSTVDSFGQLRQAKQVIEMAANGENVQNELKKRGWRNFHLWVRYDRKKVREASATRLGWYTVPWSRRMMLDMLLDALNNGWLDVNSLDFIAEMGDLELEMETQKLKAATGSKDDRIMSLGIVLFSMHALETRHADRWVTRGRMNQSDPNPMFARFTGPGEQGSMSAQDTEEEDRMREPSTSYAYTVVNPRSPDADLLRPAGATLWSPKSEE